MTIGLDWAQEILVGILLASYSLSLLWIFIFCVYEFKLVWGTKNRQNYAPQATMAEKDFPNITIQLPIYNEPNVVDRLLQAVTQLSYPKGKLDIQVLDDSSFTVLENTKKLVAKYKANGHTISLLHRTKRKGFKAGALKAGLKKAQGSLIAIFDADFIPPSDWLLQTVPHFVDQKIGMVQTRWEHLNKKQSILTRVMAFALDIHFLLEQNARYEKQHLMNFNGTAGIWRKACILDAGNWEGDTLTEDLDLSMRAQLKGWQFKFLKDVIAPAELPVTVAALRSQQFRWNKGGAENFQKLSRKLRQSTIISSKQKRNVLLHLLTSSMHIPVLLLILFTLPLMLVQQEYPMFQFIFQLFSLFFIGTLLLMISYWKAFKQEQRFSVKLLLAYALHFLQFYAVIMGFSVHNTKAALLGHLRKKSPFVRTPKFNLNSQTKTQHYSYLQPLPLGELWLEILVAVYLCSGITYFVLSGTQLDWTLLPLLLLALSGFIMHIYFARNPKAAL